MWQLLIMLVTGCLAYRYWMHLTKDKNYPSLAVKAGGVFFGAVAALVALVIVVPNGMLDNAFNKSVSIAKPSIIAEAAVASYKESDALGHDKTYSKADAVSLAKETVLIINEAEKNLKLALETSDANGYQAYVAKPVIDLIHKWPAFGNSSTAVEPYRSCYYAADYFYQFSDTYNVSKDSVRNRKNREWTNEKFNIEYLKCKTAMKN